MVLHAAVAAAVLRCMNRLLRMTSAGAVVVQSALLLLGGGASLRAGLGGREDGSLGRQAGLLLLQVEDRPVEHVVVLEALAVEQLLEEALEVGVIGPVLEAEGAAVFKVGAEFGRVALAQLFGRGRHLAVHDALVLLLLGVGLEALPGEGAADEVHEDVAERFQVVAAALLDANVRVDRGITSGSGQVLVLAVGDVLVGAGIAVLLGKAEIDDVDDRLTLPETNKEIIGLNVAMDEGLGMDVFQPAEELVGKHEHRLELESPAAVIEQILQRRTQQIQYHHIVVAFNSVPTNVGDSDCCGGEGWGGKGSKESMCVSIGPCDKNKEIVKLCQTPNRFRASFSGQDHRHSSPG